MSNIYESLGYEVKTQSKTERISCVVAPDILREFDRIKDEIQESRNHLINIAMRDFIINYRKQEVK